MQRSTGAPVRTCDTDSRSQKMRARELRKNFSEHSHEGVTRGRDAAGAL